jgi:glucosyl-dolichyl phosphate glucuronosyltransferase
MSTGDKGHFDGSDRMYVSVVICVYSMQRWEQSRAAVASVLGQRPRPAEVLVVVDHNPGLAARARDELPGVTLLESCQPPGLSGARNTGLQAATQPVTAFLDDDAQARPGWLAALVEPFNSPHVVATGGSVHPWWPTSRPRWLPPTFDWVVGCSYQGLPKTVGAVRNPIGANMSLRTSAALAVGGFELRLGRVGTRPAGCEETELAIRLTTAQPGSVVLYVPHAAVDHHVGRERVNLTYFLRRCWYEGQSKARVVRLAGASAGLQRERHHAVSVIPSSLARDLWDGVTGDRDALARAAAAVGGLTAAVAGYLTGRATQESSAPPRHRNGASHERSEVTSSHEGSSQCRQSYSRRDAAGAWSRFPGPAIRRYSKSGAAPSSAGPWTASSRRASRRSP